MPSLAEIAADLQPQEKEIELNGKKLQIRGLQSDEISKISSRFPAFGKFIEQARDASTSTITDADGNVTADPNATKKVDISNLFTLGGDAWPAVIACAVGLPGDAPTEKLAGSFLMEFQQMIVNEVLQMSFPQSRPLAAGGDNSASQ